MSKINLIKELTNELLRHCHLYYDLDAPQISDSEYDKLFDKLKQLEDSENFWLANSPTRKVQGEVLPYLNKVRHSVPMLSADKSTRIEDVEKFINGKPYIASYKLDGSTVVLKYKDGKLIQGLSRGSGIDGEDITHTVKMIKNLPTTIPYKKYLEIRGEALIPWKYYNEMNKNGDMGHPRNVASGGLRQLDANIAKDRNIYFYAFTLVNWKEIGINRKGNSLSFLMDNGFDIVPSVEVFPENNSVEEIITKFLDRKSYGNPTDGWVFEYDDLEYGESLGSTEHHDRRLFALKPERTDYTTKFTGIEFKTCRSGLVSLTATFDPVEIDNTMVSKATLHNVSYYENLQLGIGDEIVVAKMNEIIPAVLGNNTKSNTYKLPTACPTCGHSLALRTSDTGTKNLYCNNPNCQAQLVGKLTHFVSKHAMNIQGVSESIIETLVDNGYIECYSDIYNLSEYKDVLIAIDGFGEKSYENLINSINTSKNTTLERFIVAMGIPNIGRSAAKTIAKHFKGDLNAFVRETVNGFDYTALEDFGQVAHDSIYKWLMDFSKKDLIALSQCLTFNTDEHQTQNIADNPFNGKNVAVTGKLTQFTRDTINAKLEGLGAKPVSGVTSKTDYLINNDSTSQSSKNKKANELNIPIITETQFLSMIGE